jgi:uncharacterized delta-60 repeat protein
MEQAALDALFFSTSNTASGVALQADGRIVVAGSLYQFAGSEDFALSRFNADGTTDPTFAGNGMAVTDFGGTSDIGHCVAVQSDGRIIVGGVSGGRFAIVRFNPNGTLDTSFNSSGKVTTSFGSNPAVGSSMALQTDGKIVVAGSTHNGSDYDFAVARYHANGSQDTSFREPLLTRIL